MNPRIFFRKWHRWASLVIALPFLSVIVSGLLLQLKKDVAWVQPPAKRGTGKTPTIRFDQILAAVQSVPESEVQSWDDIERVDVRPDKGMCKVRCRNGWEIQVNTGDSQGSVLQVAYRRTDAIEAFHDGSWYHPGAKLWVFLPTAVGVLTLWGTGMYLFVLPWWVKWRRKRIS